MKLHYAIGISSVNHAHKNIVPTVSSLTDNETQGIETA